MRIIFAVLMLTSCAVSTCPNPVLDTYGEECLYKPYTNSRDEQSLCAFSAIAKHNKQVRNFNEKSSSIRLK